MEGLGGDTLHLNTYWPGNSHGPLNYQWGWKCNNLVVCPGERGNEFFWT